MKNGMSYGLDLEGKNEDNCKVDFNNFNKKLLPNFDELVGLLESRKSR